jgi:hypothetical protein
MPDTPITFEIDADVLSAAQKVVVRICNYPGQCEFHLRQADIEHMASVINAYLGQSAQELATLDEPDIDDGFDAEAENEARERVYENRHYEGDGVFAENH